MKNIIYGKNSVIEFLKKNNIPDSALIKKGIKKDNKVDFIINFCKNNNIKIEFTNENELNRITSNNNHQGIVLYIKRQKVNFIEIEDLIEILLNEDKSCVALLDSIQDTHNMGAIIRSAAFFGVSAIVIPERHSAPINEIVCKTSSGAVENILISKVNNLKYAIELLKQNDFWVYGTYIDEGKDLKTVEFDKKTALILGSEGKGIKRTIKNNCDFLIYINRLGNIESLNVSVSAGILFYEYSRQNK